MSAYKNGLLAMKAMETVAEGDYWGFAQLAWPEKTAKVTTPARRKLYARSAGCLLGKMRYAGLVREDYCADGFDHRPVKPPLTGRGGKAAPVDDWFLKPYVPSQPAAAKVEQPPEPAEEQPRKQIAALLRRRNVNP